MIARYIRDRVVHTIEDRTRTGMLVGIFGLSWIYEAVKAKLAAHRQATQIRYDLEQEVADKTTN